MQKTQIKIIPDKDDPTMCVLILKIPIHTIDLVKQYQAMKAMPSEAPVVTPSGRVKKGFFPMSDTKWANLIEAISYFRGRRAWPPAKTTYYWEQVKNYSEANGRFYRDYGLAIINFAMRDEAKGLKPWFTWAKQQPGLFTPEDFNA